jgi:N-acetylglucosaminyltransferase II (MGAT2)
MRWITPKRLLKIVFTTSAVSFILMNLVLLFRDDSDDDSDISVSNADFSQVLMNSGQNGSLLPPQYKQYTRAGHLWTFGFHGTNDNVDMVSNSSSERMSQLPRVSAMNGNLSAIRDIIWENNRRQTILNLDRFDLQASESTVVIVIQVHNRPEYLRHLVTSLSRASDIEKTLLIFSHAYYSDELNDIVGSINFAPVIY